MRLVLDTNVVTSGLLWQGPPYQLLRTVRQRPTLHIYSSVALFDELADVLMRASLHKRLSAIGRQATDVLLDYSAIAQIIEVAPLARPVCRDPDDDAVPALARAARAELIVSGDQDLLALGQFEGIPIVTARAALERLVVPG